MTAKLPLPAKDEQRYLNKLTPEQKVFVVKRLATYDTPTAIVRDLKALFGVEVTPQAIDHYHPHKAAVKRLAPYWQELFRETRKAYIAACAEAGTMQEMVRVRLREDMVLMARDAGHYRVANELLDSIAKEAGQMFTSRQTPAPSGAPAPMRRSFRIVHEYDDGIEVVSPGSPGARTLHVRLPGKKDQAAPVKKPSID